MAFNNFVAPYFKNCLTIDDLNGLNIEIIRNLLYKSYIEDFVEFCLNLGGETAEVMKEILAVHILLKCLFIK
jgi:V-type H+-transporting ATPase subunit d